MKRQDILEIIVSNPQAIFKNGNTEAGKYSEYPEQFQVVGMSHDKSYARVKRVRVCIDNYILNEEGTNYVNDEEGNWIHDTRPVSERARIVYGEVQSMPTRLVLKSDLTEGAMLSTSIAKTERMMAEDAEREAKRERGQAMVDEIAPLLVALGISEKEEHVTDKYGARWGRVTLDLEGDQLACLISVLKSALVEVGV